MTYPKNSLKYCCEKCNYQCCKTQDWQRHILTQKHNKLTNTYQFSMPKIYCCINCGNEYKHKQSLYNHKKKCGFENNSNSNLNSNDPNIMNLVLELVKQNSEFKEILVEQNKYIVEQNKQNQNLQIQFIEMAKEKSITTNSHNTTNNTTNNNNHFNLNLFLNERCKNALNMVEFIEQLNVTIHDLEETGRLGYAEGISRIFINGLKNLDVYERPIHCSDAKRETIYIKNENKWEKDDDNKSNLEKAVRKVGQKNMKCITQWQKLHPYFNDSSAKDSDKYLHMVSNSMCGGSVEETRDNYNKIKKNIIKETIIKKTK
jgi:hypothetical protein